jgi:hypothetical protein
MHANCRRVTMASDWNCHNSGHYTSSCSLFKHDVSETGFCPRFQVEHTQFGSTDRVMLSPDREDVPPEDGAESSLRNVVFQ